MHVFWQTSAQHSIAPHSGITNNANGHAGGQARKTASQAGRQMCISIEQEVRGVDCNSPTAHVKPVPIEAESWRNNIACFATK